jgi:glycerol-3-phosphate dehydrogenase
VTIAHPADKRPVYATPWEGAVLFGTTDVDHDAEISHEPVISPDEIAYLLEGLQVCFPSLHLSLRDCISTFAGIRAILSAGKLAPSSEPREHAVWANAGLITITGGKLTTFRRLAWDALEAAKPFLKATHLAGRGDPIFPSVADRQKEDPGVPPVAWRRLKGRYGEDAWELVRMAAREDLEPIPQTDTLWAELPFVAKHEKIRNLSDLLLRRVRVGLVTPEGGRAYLDRVRRICEPVVPWNRERWDNEITMYRENWQEAYGVPKS